jgi:hypothetical protein
VIVGDVELEVILLLSASFDELDFSPASAARPKKNLALEILELIGERDNLALNT